MSRLLRVPDAADIASLRIAIASVSITTRFTTLTNITTTVSATSFTAIIDITIRS